MLRSASARASSLAVSVEDTAIGEKPRLVQTVTGTAKQRQGSPAVVERLIEPADADVNEGTLHKDLTAQIPGCMFGRAIELDQRRVRVPALQQREDQAQARLDRAKIQLSRLGNGYRAP